MNKQLISLFAAALLLFLPACQQLGRPLTLRELIANAQEGNTAAQYLYACMALTGKGMNQNPELAFQWFRVAAAADHPAANGALGACYLAGLGTPKDIRQGMRYLRKAAGMGHVPSALTLANLAKGRGDTEEYFKWLFRAASSGDQATQDYLADLYLAGTKLPIADREMVDYLRYAAMDDNPKALFGMYLCNLHGKGLPKNLLLAEAWLRLAAKAGSEEAKNVLESRRQK